MIFQRKYDWSTFTGLSVSAQVAGEMLERIEAEQGAVTKKAFLEASRPADSPTHDLFEWDNEKAAEKYRLQQSGRYIRDLKVSVVKGEAHGDGTIDVEIEERPWEGPAYMNTGENRLSCATYSNVYHALQDDEKRANLLRNAATELYIFKQKYNKLRELSGVFWAIDEFTRKINHGEV